MKFFCGGLRCVSDPPTLQTAVIVQQLLPDGGRSAGSKPHLAVGKCHAEIVLQLFHSLVGEKVEKVCRQNRSHRHPPDRRNSGNGCPPSCWGVYPRGRDSTSCRSGLRRSRTAPLPARSRWRALRPKRQRCYPPSQWAGYRRKDEAR